MTKYIWKVNLLKISIIYHIDKIKTRIISIDREKAFDNIQSLLMIKNCQQTRNRQKLSQFGKEHLKKP